MTPDAPVRLGKKSVFWAAAETGGTTVLTLAAMLLMARMMHPDEFGTAALVIGGIQFLNLFVEGLFHDGLIQNPHSDDDKFEAAFSLVQIVAFAIVLAALGVALAGRHAAWGGTAWLCVGAALSLPASGALGVGNARMRRDLIFREVAHASLAGRLVGTVAGLVLAASGMGAWSLVIQFTLIAVLQACVLYGVSGWRPRPRARFGILWPICRFAVPYAFMHSVVALRLQLYLMLVAGIMGLSAAGFMNVAFRLTTTPQIVLTTALTNLCLPLLARHQDRAGELARSFGVVTRMVMSTTIPAFIGLALTARDLVPVLLGATWLTVIPLVQVLAVGAALGFLRFAASSTLRACGHVRYSFASSVFQLAVTVPGLLLLRPLGLMDAVWLWVLPAAVQLPVTFVALYRECRIGPRAALLPLLPGLAATAAMAVVVLALAAALQDQPVLLRLAGQIGGGAAAAGVVLALADGEARAYLRRRALV